MEITDDLKIVKRLRKGERKKLSILIDDSLSNWLYEKNLSPTAIFKEACKELGYGIVEVYDVPKEEE